MAQDEKPFPWMRNRRVAAQSPEYLEAPSGALTGSWLVCDRDDYRDGKYVATGCGMPMSYGSERCPYEVSTERGGWVIVSKRGQYLRSNGAWSGDRRLVRRFKTPLAAARAAELHQSCSGGDDING